MIKKSFSAAALFAAVLITCLSCSSAPPQPTIEEQETIEAFVRLRDQVGSTVTYDQFGTLMAEAKTKIEKLKNAEKKNECFVSAINRSYASYETCQKATLVIEQTKDETRRIDLETTRAFMIGYAAVSLSKAQECFKQR